MEAVTQLDKRRARRGSQNLGAGEGDPEGENSVLKDEELDGQKRIPGTERVVNTKVEELALSVKKLQDKRMETGRKEKEKRDALAVVMVNEGINNYPLDDEFEVVLKSTHKAYVRKIKKDDESE